MDFEGPTSSRPRKAAQPSVLEVVVKPLQRETGPPYMVPGSDAENYAAKRFPHKPLRRVRNGLRVPTVKSFLATLPHVFLRGQSAGLTATYHFTPAGSEALKATVVIREKPFASKPVIPARPTSQ